MPRRPKTEAKQLPPPIRRRSKRLRKKLRIEEFQELGFAVGFRLSNELSPKDRDAFWIGFIEQIELRGLAFGGNEEGYVTKFGRGSATEEDRAAIRAWLEARPEVGSVALGDLEDAWYGHAESEA
jgi:uncharacterized protein YggL (DUF469 family)